MRGNIIDYAGDKQKEARKEWVIYE